jgi:hypothetical protein
MILSQSFGGKLLIANITLPPIYSVVETGMCPAFEKGCYGQLRLRKWDIDGNLGMGKIRFWEDLWFDTCSLAIQY